MLRERGSCAIGRHALGNDVVRYLGTNRWMQVRVEVPWSDDDPIRLHAGDVIGVFNLPGGRRLRIEPKLPLRHLFDMMQSAGMLPELRPDERPSEVGATDGLFVALVKILVERVSARIRRGLHRAYEDRSESLDVVRGRLDVIATTRAFMRAETRVTCSFDELTADLADNRILAWTLSVLRHAPLDGRHDLRRTLVSCARDLAGDVALVPVTPQECLGRRYDPLNADYRAMHVLCALLLGAAGPEASHGSSATVPFWLAMPRVFERYVAAIAKRVTSASSVRAQYAIRVAGHDAADLEYRADLVLMDRAGGPVAVLDTKYATFPDRPNPEAIQQVVTYATALGVPRACLLYATDRKVTTRHVVGPVTVFSAGFDLESTTDVHERCLTLLVAQLTASRS